MMRLFIVACFAVFCQLSFIPVSSSCNETAAKVSVMEDQRAAEGVDKVKEEKSADAPMQAKAESKVQKAPLEVGSKALAETAASAKHFDMKALIERIKESHAIGVFTKLALRSDAMDMIDLIKSYRQKRKHLTLDEVRARFDGLLLKVLALLDDDPALSCDISMSREGIWKSLLEVKV